MDNPEIKRLEHDLKWWRSCAESKDAIMDLQSTLLKAQVDELDHITAHNAELIDAIKGMLESNDEWVGDMHYDMLWCSYCHETQAKGHAIDCSRQRASFLVEGDL